MLQTTALSYKEEPATKQETILETYMQALGML